jgi:exopolysaccharide biosynthesis predicted pyruvyltransferase EpsI
MRYREGLLPPVGEAMLLAAPGGNTGDDLIRRGCEAFLAHTGLDVWSSDGSIESAVEAGDAAYLADALGTFPGLVFFAGGGNVGIYPSNERLRTVVISTARRSRGFLVLPQSVFAIEPALLDPRVEVWARDAASGELVVGAGIESALVPDAAWALAAEFPSVPEGEGTFHILRGKGRCSERVEHQIAFDGPSEDLTFRTQLEEVVARLRPFASVVSDRLHGAIVSVMMGKRTALLPVAYHKNRSFYDTWFEDEPGVGFVESSAELAEFLAGSAVPRRDLAERFHDRAGPALARFLDRTTVPAA